MCVCACIEYKYQGDGGASSLKAWHRLKRGSNDKKEGAEGSQGNLLLWLGGGGGGWGLRPRLISCWVWAPALCLHRQQWLFWWSIGLLEATSQAISTDLTPHPPGLSVIRSAGNLLKKCHVCLEMGRVGAGVEKQPEHTLNPHGMTVVCRPKERIWNEKRPPRFYICTKVRDHSGECCSGSVRCWRIQRTWQWRWITAWNRSRT